MFPGKLRLPKERWSLINKAAHRRKLIYAFPNLFVHLEALGSLKQKISMIRSGNKCGDTPIRSSVSKYAVAAFQMVPVFRLPQLIPSDRMFFPYSYTPKNKFYISAVDVEGARLVEVQLV